MNTAPVSPQVQLAQSAAEMGNLLKNIASENTDLSQKMIGINVAEKVQNQKLGTLLDVVG